MREFDPARDLKSPPFALDAAGADWVLATLDRMDEETKLRQLFNLLFIGDDPAEAARLAAGRPGGVTRFVGDDLERAWGCTAALLAGSEIPLLISGDIEGGGISPACATQLPNQLGLAAIRMRELAEAAIDVLAAEAATLGYNWTFSPVVDINAAFRSAIVATRSYGSDLETILALARASVRTFQRHGIAATLKHWPGEGFDDRDQHLVTTVNPLDEARWEATFGGLYRTLIADGVMCVMAGHIAWPAYAKRHGATGAEAFCPASLSALLNRRLLREELEFNGLIVSDATGMAGFGGWLPRADALPLVIENGCDMILFPTSFEADLEALRAALADGRLSRRRIDESVARILGLKAALGLHARSPEERLLPLARVQEAIGDAEHREIARRAADAGITLVKDVDGLLPLDPDRHRRIVVVTDPDRTGFAGRPPEPLVLGDLLAGRGFAVRPYDQERPPTTDDTDLVLYLLGQESLLCTSHVYLDWQRMQGGFRGAMRRFWHEIPCLLVSFGHPYYLYDAPHMPCVINAYTAIAPMQRAVADRLLSRERFAGQSPVDAFCGQPADYVLRRVASM